MKKSKDNKKDFINFISSMSDVEINELIKSKGKPPKKVNMARIVPDKK